jgi:hypothetical protein
VLNVILKTQLNQLIDNTKKTVNNISNLALPEAWKVLQLATVEIIQNIENYYPNLKGSDKKVIALELISDFYDKVFNIINIPFVPTMFQPIIRKYIKALLMILVGSTIDALVTTFRNAGIFVSVPTVDPSIDLIPKVSDK